MVLRFLKDGFRIMYVCFSFAIAARPVQRCGEVFKFISQAKFLFSVEVNCCPLSLRQHRAMPWKARWALVRLTMVVGIVFFRWSNS